MTNCTAATTLFNGTQMGGMALNGSNLYWVEGGTSQIHECTVPSCSTITTPVTSAGFVNWVAVSPN